MNEEYNGGTIKKTGSGYVFEREGVIAGPYIAVASIKKLFPVIKTQADIDQAGVEPAEPDDKPTKIEIKDDNSKDTSILVEKSQKTIQNTPKNVISKPLSEENVNVVKSEDASNGKQSE